MGDRVGLRDRLESRHTVRRCASFGFGLRLARRSPAVSPIVGPVTRGRPRPTRGPRAESKKSDLTRPVLKHGPRSLTCARVVESFYETREAQ